MHPLAFALKRSHLTSVNFGRRIFVLSKVPELEMMTPARYDLLSLVWGDRSRTGGDLRLYGEYQDEIRRTLGLAGATITKMLDRLVALGLVTRRRCDADRRRNYIRLTESGIDCMRRAFSLVFGGRALSKAYESHAMINARPRRLHIASKRGPICLVDLPPLVPDIEFTDAEWTRMTEGTDEYPPRRRRTRRARA